LAIRIAQIFVKNVTFVYRFGAIVYKPLQSVVYRLILFGQNIIVPAQSLKDYLEKSIFKTNSVNVVINFIPVRKPQKDQNIELDIEQRSKNIITVSRHVKRKRLERVIDFAKNYSEFNFYLIGGGKNIEAYKEHVSTLGLNNLHVLGEKSNMEAFYKRASLLFLPSKGEGFSYSVCEAVLNDCKVLVYDDLGGNNFYFQKDPNYFIIKNVKSQFELFEKATSNGFQPSDYSFLPSEKQMGHNYYEVISKLKD
jgi:glycosyltransferase involved in cell wall biosynthesis